jgi:hypothetical protein
VGGADEPAACRGSSTDGSSTASATPSFSARSAVGISMTSASIATSSTCATGILRRWAATVIAASKHAA